jgi:acetoin utilization deacetylase AcuC-like enzyme
LSQAFPGAQAKLAICLAGVDVHDSDCFGRLKLGENGLSERDRMLFGFCWRYRVRSSEGSSWPS